MPLGQRWRYNAETPCHVPVLVMWAVHMLSFAVLFLCLFLMVYEDFAHEPHR